MQVFRHLPTHPCEPLSLAIGNFDGMHLGHQALLQANIHAAIRLDKIPAVLTFEPHPREFFTPHNAPARLTTLREKLELFEAAGLQKVFICAFNRPFAAISADDFLKILREQLNTNTVLVGHDFKFGAKRLGDVDSFKAAGFADGDVLEVLVNVVLNLLTNYTNHIAGTDIDFPVPEKLAA